MTVDAAFTPPRPLSIAVAGAGLIGQRHLQEIARHPQLRLSAIADPGAQAGQLAAQLGVPHFADVTDLLAAQQPDGMVLATPNALHVPQALQCMAAGVAVLIEKPVAHTVAEAERLVQETERTGARVLVGHHRLHSPLLQHAAQVVRSGVLGPLVGVMGSAVFYKPDADGYFDPPTDWRRKPGGGPILINLIHEIGNLRALVGEVVAVQAMASSATRGFEVEDTVAMNFRFANGALGTFLLSDTAACARSWEQTSQENLAYHHEGDEDAYVLMGTRGSLSIPTLRLRRYTRDADRSWFKPFERETLQAERLDPLALQMAHFAQVICGHAAPLVSARDGLLNLRVTEAVAQAAQSGQLVRLD